MKTKILLIAILFAASFPVSADFETVALSYEVGLDNFTTPVTQNGMLVFRECGDCDTKSIRMTPSTQFNVNGNAVTLKEFRKQVFRVRDRSVVPVTVNHHLESDTVVSVSVSL